MCKGRPEGAIWIKLLQHNTRCYTLFYGFRTTTAISHRVNSKHSNQKRKICTKIQKRRVYLRLKFGVAGLPALLTLLLGPDTPPPSPHTITVVAILTLGLPRLVTMITTLTQHSAHILDCGGSFSIAGQTVANWRHFVEERIDEPIMHVDRVIITPKIIVPDYFGEEKFKNGFEVNSEILEGEDFLQYEEDLKKHRSAI
mgnify:CR=1 FL=1